MRSRGSSSAPVAAAARAAGIDVRAVLSNDIVGDLTGPQRAASARRIRLFSEGLPIPFSDAALDEARRLGGLADGPSRQLARHVADVADAHALAVRPLLVARADRFLRGGDHTAFTEQGFAAVRFTEVAESYDHQHQDVRIGGGRGYGDLPEFVDAEQSRRGRAVNAAALAHLANAPSPPPGFAPVVEGPDPATTLRWQRSPEPDVVGYELLRRSSDAAPLGQARRGAGGRTEVTTQEQGSLALRGALGRDRDGYRSPPAFPRLEQSGR
ncbi:MAG: hypothetical protein R3B09_33870 [Nannocystaceae bacterium]